MNKKIAEWFTSLYKQGLTRREVQERMSMDMASVIKNESVGMFEGGTGIGKSYAALMGALAFRYRAQDRLDEAKDDENNEEEKISPIVYATGTIALQGQIVNRDLPALCKALGLDDLEFMLVKGRGRYACLKKLWNSSSQPLSLFEGEDDLKNKGIKAATKMRALFKKGEWNGDLDSYKEKVTAETISDVTIDGNACSGRRCSEFGDCPFFAARKQMGKADLLVVNHDLLLSDLSLGGGVIMPCKPRNTDYLIDEAHRLAECAVKHFGGSFGIQGTSRLMESLAKKMDRMFRGMNVLPADLDEDKEVILQFTLDIRNMLSELLTLLNECDQQFSNGNWLFPDDEVPDMLESPFLSLKAKSKDLLKALDAIKTVFEDNDEVRLKFGDKVSDQHMSDFGFYFGRMKRLFHALEIMMDEESLGSQKERTTLTTRWLDSSDDEITVNAFPTFAADALRLNVWSKVRSASLFSATLRSLGSFDKFKNDMGLRGMQEYYYKSPFDYSKAKLYLAADGDDPNSDKHIETTAQTVIAAHEKAESGVLVIFTAIKFMRKTEESIKNRAPEILKDILIQGDMSRSEILRRHTKAINKGKKSVIFGLASFGEGVDLPGDQCGYVIIPKLPFSVPTTPMEQSRVRWIKAQGENPFMTYSLPEASIKLTQMVGRLIRTETDIGSVVVLDNRVCTKRYGGLLIKGLPEFTVSRFSVQKYAD